jgi:hypothetical protein
MKLSAVIVPILRVDAVGVLLGLALTAIAATLAVGPRLLAHARSHAEQQGELEARRKDAVQVDQQTDVARRYLDMLKSQTSAAVRLQPPTHINQRMGEMASLAEPCNISIAQLSPGTPPPISTTPAATGTPAPTPESRATIVPIKLAGTGSYADLSRFLKSLHDTFRDTAVTSLHIIAQPDGKGSEKQVASFTVDFAWYAAPAVSNDAPPKP